MTGTYLGFMAHRRLIRSLPHSLYSLTVRNARLVYGLPLSWHFKCAEVILYFICLLSVRALGLPSFNEGLEADGLFLRGRNPLRVHAFPPLFLVPPCRCSTRTVQSCGSC